MKVAAMISDAVNRGAGRSLHRVGKIHMAAWEGLMRAADPDIVGDGEDEGTPTTEEIACGFAGALIVVLEQYGVTKDTFMQAFANNWAWAEQ